MSIILLVVVLFTLFALNVPIAWSLGLSSLLALALFTDVPLTVVPQRMFTGTDTFALVAIPFFLLAGELMARSGISDKLIDLANAVVGHIRGGLGGVSVGSSMLFSAVSGSGIATTAAMGKITIPAMRSRGYDTSYAVGVQAASGAMGIVIPPSIVMILYSVISGASVAGLFLGGIIPGILMAAALLGMAYIIARRRSYPTEPRANFRSLPLRFLQAIPALLMPAIILGGILGGIFTPTESAVAAVFYALVYGLLNRQLNVRKIIDALQDTVLSTAMIMLLVACASVFAWVVTSERLPQLLASGLSGIGENPLLVIVICTSMLLVGGMFLDTTAALIILVPVMMPLISLAGVDPIHFGVVAVVALAIGLATPPVGLNLFVAADIGKVDVAVASRAVLPFIGALLLALALMVLIPDVVLLVPNLF